MTLTRALQLLVLFAQGCHDMKASWQAIARGPYGSEFLHQVWLQYAPMQWHRSLSIATTFAQLVRFQKPTNYWRTNAGQSELLRDLEGSDEEVTTQALLTLVSLCWGGADGSDVIEAISKKADYLERHLFSEHHGIWDAAAWGWGLSRSSLAFPPASLAVLDRLLSLWLSGDDKWDTVPFAIARTARCLKDWRTWRPQLTEAQKSFLRGEAERDIRDPDDASVLFAALFIGTVTRDIWPENELRKRVNSLGDATFLEPAELELLRKGLRKVSS